MGSCCGSVGRAVPSDTRDLWLESRHQQNFSYQIIYLLYKRKDENKVKEAGNGPCLKKYMYSLWRLLLTFLYLLLLLLVVVTAVVVVADVDAVVVDDVVVVVAADVVVVVVADDVVVVVVLERESFIQVFKLQL